MVTIGIFCDLQKAFDCCSHSILLKKLSKIGIRNNELLWFKNYLSNRFQFVSNGTENSSKLPINKGVPQGSILGPILFLIYINDLYKCTNLYTLLFADDTTFLVHGKDLKEAIKLINIELRKICYWFRANELSLHPDKTKLMIFTKNDDLIDWNEVTVFLDFNNFNQNNDNLIKQLEVVNCSSSLPVVKFLGVFIDPKLNFKYHHENLSGKISKSLYAIKASKNLLNENSLLMLYNSLIHSHYLYANQIWSCCPRTSLRKLELLQKKALRIISQSNYNAHTAPLFKKHDILKLDDQISYSKLVFFFDYLKNRLPATFNNIWFKNGERHGYQLRTDNTYHIPWCRLKSFDTFPIYSFQKLWNEFSSENHNIANISSRKQFCKQLKNHLIEKLTLVCNRANCTECQP